MCVCVCVFYYLAEAKVIPIVLEAKHMFVTQLINTT